MENQIEKMTKEMELVAKELWSGNESAYQILSGYIAGWQEFLQRMIDKMCQWAETGTEIPLDIILCQLENFEVAMNKKDDLMLADVLNFEWKETLKYYKGLLEIYDGQ